MIKRWRVVANHLGASRYIGPRYFCFLGNTFYLGASLYAGLRQCVFLNGVPLIWNDNNFCNNHKLWDIGDFGKRLICRNYCLRAPSNCLKIISITITISILLTSRNPSNSKVVSRLKRLKQLFPIWFAFSTPRGSNLRNLNYLFLGQSFISLYCKNLKGHKSIRLSQKVSKHISYNFRGKSC